MFRKNYFTFLLATCLLLLLGGIVGVAQTAPTSGKIELKKADGTVEPVQGASVEVFRTDIKGKLPSAKTNKKGEFSFAGFSLGATYTLAVSAPNIKPEIYPNVRAGMERIVISVTEGDGKRLTEDEVRQALTAPAIPTNAAASTTTNASSTNTATTAAAPAGEQKKEMTSEEAKKAQAEYEAKVKEVTAKNESIKAKTAVIQKVLAEGNEAYNAKNYDVAVAKFNEGYEADKEFVGSAPVLLNNKGAALTGRAVVVYNQGVKATDTAAKVEGLGKAKKDLADAADAYNQSWTILKAAQPADIVDPKNYEANKMNALRGIKETFRLMAVTEQVDPAKTTIAKTLIPEYINVETDAAEKVKAQVILGDVYRVAGDSTNAVAEYKKVLATSPDSPDALAGAGLSLAYAGYNQDGSINMTMMQEAVGYLQRFAESAPANHKLKQSVTDTVAYLKTLNVKTEKTSGGKKKN